MKKPKKINKKGKQLKQMLSDHSDKITRYSTFDIEKIIEGTKRVTIHDWVSKEYVIASYKGKSKNIFSKHNIYTLKLFMYLVKRGLKRDSASEISNEFAVMDLENVKKYKLLAIANHENSKKIFKFIEKNKPYTIFKTNATDIMLINIENIIDTVDRDITNFKKREKRRLESLKG